MTKTYPNTVLQERARAADIPCRVLWEVPGPKNTAIAWLTCYALGQSIAIVQTYTRGDGWEILTPDGGNDIDATIADAFARCKALVPA